MSKRKDIAKNLQLYVNWKPGDYAPYTKEEFIKILKDAIKELNTSCESCKYFDKIGECSLYGTYTKETDYCTNHEHNEEIGQA